MRQTGTIIIFGISLLVLYLPGELVMYLFGTQIHQFVRGRAIPAIAVTVGYILLGFIVLFTIGGILRYFTFSRYGGKDPMGNEERKIMRRAGLRPPPRT